ncbi:MAG: hypothetical protein IPG04_17640 [Polyangiaceae bacterium]|nr:hypothetical protein [Polyangiaceae bacterium]
MRVLRPWALGGLILVASLNFSVESSAQGGPLPGDIAVAKAKEALKHYEAAEWAGGLSCPRRLTRGAPRSCSASTGARSATCDKLLRGAHALPRHRRRAAPG